MPTTLCPATANNLQNLARSADHPLHVKTGTTAVATRTMADLLLKSLYENFSNKLQKIVRNKSIHNERNFIYLPDECVV
jgi:hypothetical protein